MLSTETKMIETMNENPGEMHIERRIDGRLYLVEGDVARAVKARRPFPWSAPDRYISLADDDDNEIRLIAALGELDEESRKLIEAELREICFMIEVTGVESIDSEFEIRNWKVRTRQGHCLFQTKEDRWPIPLAQGGYLIQSIDSNLFYIPDPRGMDEKSRKLLWAFTD
ncbi:MAG: DUF1854 domain-containing protein [bacterium]